MKNTHTFRNYMNQTERKTFQKKKLDCQEENGYRKKM